MSKNLNSLTKQELIEKIKSLNAFIDKSRDQIPLHILNNISQFIYKVDLDGNVIFINQHGLDFLGYTIKDIENGLHYSDLVDETEIDKTRSNITKIQKDGFTRGNQYILKHKDGTKREVILYSDLLHPEEGPDTIIGIAVDISDSKRINRQLEQSEEFNRILLESNPIPTLIHSDGIIHYINDSGMKLFEAKTSEEIIGKQVKDIIHPESVDIVMNRIDQCQKQGIVNKPMEQKLVTTKNTIIYVKTTALPTTYFNKPAIMALIEDITERKKIEKAKSERITFLNNLNKIDLILRSPESLTQVLNDILESCLEIFGSDRAWLLYPLDPETETWSVPLEKYRPEYPSKLNKDIQVVTSAKDKQILTQLYNSDEPIIYDLEHNHEILSDLVEAHGFKSLIQIAIRPRIGKAWIFGMHQCSHIRNWSESDINLFKEIARRLTEGLSSLIYFDNMRKNEENLSVTLRSIGDAVISTDPEGKVNRMNIIAEDLTGWTEEEAKGRNLSDVFNIVSSITGEVVDNPVKQVVINGTIKGLANHTLLIAKDGSRRQIADSAAPILDDNNELLGVVLVFRDVTEEYHREQQLRESEENLKFIIDQMPTSLLIVDKSGKALKINNSFIKTYSITNKDDFIENFNLFRDSLLKDLGVKDVEEQISRGNTLRLPDLYLSPRKLINWGGGEIKKDMIVDLTIYPVKHLSGDINHIVLSCKNVTDERRLEKELRRLDKLESVGVLAGGIAHDFNNILTALGSNISLALEYNENKNSKLAQILSNAHDATMHATALANQLLTFSSGGTPIKETVNLRDKLLDSVKFALRGSKVKSKFEISDDLKNVDVDIHQINQVINNLIRNAVQAMPNGGEIKVGLSNFTGNVTVPGLNIDSEYVKISISDTGTGINLKDQEQVFDLFFTTKKNGKGLGLSTAYSIINKHSGVINFTSKPGAGTTFFIYLPVSDKQVIKKIQVSEIEKGKGRILIMDDEEIIRQSVQDLLEYLGFETDTAANGEEAINKYKTALSIYEPFNAVILDLTIPGGQGGEEVLASLKEIDSNVIGIVSSGYSDDKILSNYKKFGFKGVLPKPFDINNLSKVMSSVLNNK